MLLNPVVPLGPVAVKDTVVSLVPVAIVMLEICELVMLPLISRLTFVPVPVVATIVVGEGGVG